MRKLILLAILTLFLQACSTTIPSFDKMSGGGVVSNGLVQDDATQVDNTQENCGSKSSQKNCKKKH